METEEDLLIYTYVGKRNHQGLPHGRGTLTWTHTGDYFQGHFQNGVKEGRGCFYFKDGGTLSGVYKDDELIGTSTYTYPDGHYMIAENSNGDLNGEFVEYTPSGDVLTRGIHQDGLKTGRLETFDEFGGSIIGKVDSGGLLTGNNIAYVYPDGKTALVGQFEDSELVKAHPAMIERPLKREEMPTITFRKDFTESVKCDISSRDFISTQPLVVDVYENDRVYVKSSSICDAGEGLFAKVPLHEDEVVSFYNGIRLTHEEVDNRDWSLNGNTITLDEDTVLDVPNEFATVELYCATLGHKANHSSTPNCKYDIFMHPRFGYIKCIRTLKEVAVDEELTCDYGYHHKLPNSDKDDLPPWFQSLKTKTNT